MSAAGRTGKRLFTRMAQGRRLDLFIEREPVAPPMPGEVLIRVEAAPINQRVAAELTSAFASEHAAEPSLEEAIAPDSIRRHARLGTGAKYLINPNEQIAASTD